MAFNWERAVGRALPFKFYHKTGTEVFKSVSQLLFETDFLEIRVELSLLLFFSGSTLIDH
jgi:hypothetical protein